MKTKFCVFLIVCGALIAGCDSSSEPAGARMELKMKAVTSLSTINASGRSATTSLVFNEILLGVTELEFETPDEDELEEQNDIEDGENGDGENENEEIEFEGEFVLDLINGTSTPDFGVAEVLPGTYEEIEIAMGPILEGGNTLLISFKYKPEGSDSVTVEYSSNAQLELEIESDAGFQLTGGDLTQMLVLLNLDTLFSSIDLSQATVDQDGVIRINESSNAELAALIKTNFDSACEAGEDQNDDGEFDDND